MEEEWRGRGEVGRKGGGEEERKRGGEEEMWKGKEVIKGGEFEEKRRRL